MISWHLDNFTSVNAKFSDNTYDGLQKIRIKLTCVIRINSYHYTIDKIISEFFISKRNRWNLNRKKIFYFPLVYIYNVHTFILKEFIHINFYINNYLG